MAEYRQLYGFGHLRADCGGLGSAANHYARFEYGLCDHKFQRWIHDVDKKVRECYLYCRLRAGNDFRELNFATLI